MEGLLSLNTANDEIQNAILSTSYDGVKGEEHPSVSENQHKPGWLSYIDGHQGRICAYIDQAMYGFIIPEVDIT